MSTETLTLAYVVNVTIPIEANADIVDTAISDTTRDLLDILADYGVGHASIRVVSHATISTTVIRSEDSHDRDHDCDTCGRNEGAPIEDSYGDTVWYCHRHTPKDSGGAK